MTDPTALLECLVAEVYNRGNLAALEVCFTPTVLFDGQVATIEEFSDSIQCLRQLFPDLHVTLDASTALGDLVAVKWTVHHAAASCQDSADGKRQAARKSVRLFRIVDGRIAEVWFNWTARAQLQAQGHT